MIVASQIDKIMLPFFFTFTELGIFTIAMIIPEMIKGFIKTTGALLYKKYANINSRNFFRKIKKITIPLSLVTIALLTVAILATPFVIQTVYGRAYHSAILPAQLLILSILVYPFSMIFLTYFQSKEKTKVIFKQNMISSIFKIIIQAVLIPFFGLNGLIISLIISRTFNLFINIYFFKKG